jgi:AraC-like DNA-binding protein
VANELLMPSAYTRVIARELQLQERDLGRLLAGTGLPSDILQPGDETQLSAGQQLRILDNVINLVGVETAGLRVGAALEPASHGPLGFLALSSPTPRKALESLRDFLPTRIPLTALHLRDEGAELICEQQILIDVTPTQRRLMQEAFAMVVQQLVETVLGRRWQGAAFCFAHAKPGYYEHYADFLHGSCAFDAARTRVVIPAALLEAPSGAGDAATYEHTRQLCEQLLGDTPASVLTTRSRVRRLLLTLPPGSLSEEQVARFLFVSTRTLARRLAREGGSFRQLRDEVLADLAARQLMESGLSVESIAQSLGYFDSAAFRKAFRRWYGESPSEFRSSRKVTLE